MNSKSIVAALKLEMPYLRSRFGVQELGLFGSYALDQATENSDVDLLVKTNYKDLGNYFGLLDYLEAKFKTKVDLVTKHNQLNQRFLDSISKHIIYV